MFKLSSQRHLAECVLLAKLIQFILYIPQYLARCSLYICYYDLIVCIVAIPVLHSSIAFHHSIPQIVDSLIVSTFCAYVHLISVKG